LASLADHLRGYPSGDREALAGALRGAGRDAVERELTGLLRDLGRFPVDTEHEDQPWGYSVARADDGRYLGCRRGRDPAAAWEDLGDARNAARVLVDQLFRELA